MSKPVVLDTDAGGEAVDFWDCAVALVQLLVERVSIRHQATGTAIQPLPDTTVILEQLPLPNVLQEPSSLMRDDQAASSAPKELLLLRLE